MATVTSKDGTVIAYERSGSGPPLILVDGALCHRRFGPMSKMAALLAPHFTVYAYDRRGRGESGDTQPYARERELEDLAALLAAAGGSACVAGVSSGAALALEAAASGLPIHRVAAFEPPFVEVGTSGPVPDHAARLRELLAAGRRGDAVAYFMRDMVGAPGFVVVMMRLMRGTWKKLQAVAHTLPYDTAILRDFRVPTARLSGIRVPTLVLNGEKSDARLVGAARAVAAAVPGARHVTFPRQTHNVDPRVLAPALTAFFSEPEVESQPRRAPGAA